MIFKNENYDRGYFKGQEALVACAKSFLEAAKPNMIKQAIKKMAYTVPSRNGSHGRTTAYFMAVADSMLLENLVWEGMLFSTTANGVIGSREKILRILKKELEGSGQDYLNTVNCDLYRYKKRHDPFSIKKVMPTSYSENETPVVNEVAVHLKNPSLVGFLVGQMELIMHVLKNDDYSEEELLKVLIPVLSECSIPFSLAPPYLTGWDGDFTDDQNELFSLTIELFDTSLKTFIDCYLMIDSALKIHGK